MSKAVLDASALLALLQSEPGAALVATALTSGAIISAVNFSEVVAKLRDRGMPELDARAALDQLPLSIIAFDLSLAYAAGLLRPQTRAAGLSLGDRACLALAVSLGLEVLTTDRSWAALGLGITVTLIR
ncbi:MAG TPA: type II toxin-antitoxin system VapC family toxin [Ktedonobacterales bacterium]|nr:type II toxin-antitoxin system VapC family toxin [Ktedonobacterales bacterium]